MHHLLWGIPSRALSGLGQPRLMFDLSEESFHRSLEALTAYIDLFGLQEVIAARVFVRVQPLLVDMSSKRGEKWRDCLRSDLLPSLVHREGGDEPVGMNSDKEADVAVADTPWFLRLAPSWPCLVGV